MKNIFAAIILSIASSTIAFADDITPESDQAGRLNPAEGRTLNLDSLQWLPDPSLPAGSQIALVAGNPGASETFMVYVKLPPNTIIAPHTHPYAEVVAVLQGRVWNGHGEKFDKNHGELLNAGSTLVLPAGHAHYLWNEEEVIAMLTASGPWNISYVDPADDPRNK